MTARGVAGAAARLPAWAWAALAAGLVLPLLVTPVLPLIDLYNHVARFWILGRIDGDAFLASRYASNWRLLPNIGFDLPAVALSRAVGPLALGKLVVAAIVAGQFAGTLFLARALTGRVNRWTVALAAALTYSYILSWGFINYLAAQALALWTLGLWLTWRDRPALATAACGTLAVGILLCHGFAFGLYGVVIAALEVGRWLARSGRRLVDLARALALVALQAVVPAIVFLGMSTAGASTYDRPLGARVAGWYEKGELLARVRRQVVQRAEATVRVAETAWPPLDLLLFVATAGLVAWALRRRWITVAPVAIPALVAAALLAIGMPGGFLGAGHLHERLPLLFALLFAAAVAERPGAAARARPAFLALLGITLLRLVAVSAGYRPYAEGHRAFERVAAALPPGAVVAPVLVPEREGRDAFTPRCQMFAPLVVPLHRAATPLFADPTQQPMTLREPLLSIKARLVASAAEVNAAGPARSDPMVHDRLVAALAADRDASHLLICGVDRLRAPLPANLRPLSREGVLALYRVE